MYRLLPFAVLGTVIPDADIFYSFISDKAPSLYLFTHGGISHSLAGAFVLSILSYGVVTSIALIGIIPFSLVAIGGVSGFAAVLTGALLHIAIDVLACPGIPLLAPVSDRKYTIGILPGPSILLAFAALGLVLVTVTRLLEFSSGTSFLHPDCPHLPCSPRGIFPVCGYTDTRTKGAKSEPVLLAGNHARMRNTALYGSTAW